MMNLPSVTRLTLVIACVAISNNAAARPIEMVESIWCLTEVQKNLLMERFQPVMKQTENPALSLLAWRKALYLASERELHFAQERLDACRRKAQPSGSASSCDEIGVKRLERDIQGLDELEAKPLSDLDRAKMTVMVEKMRIVRSEYPLCK